MCVCMYSGLRVAGSGERGGGSGRCGPGDRAWVVARRTLASGLGAWKDFRQPLAKSVWLVGRFPPVL